MVTIGTAFSPRHNSLNSLRLALAAAVIFSHGISLGGFGTEKIIDKTTLGTIAVYGFFAISGFLIAGSATRNGSLRYLWQRFLRIFPAFWACLIVTAFGFGLIAWFHGGQHASVSEYLREPNGPVGYVAHNFWLRSYQPDIAGTLHDVPLPGIWNGSLWTLSFEFLCYLLLGILALVGILRRRWAIALLAAAVWITEAVIICVPGLNAQFDTFHNPDVTRILGFVPVFLAGSLLFVYRDKLPDSQWLALGSTVLFFGGFVLPLGNRFPPFTLTSVDLTAIFLAYPLLWLGTHLPLQWVGARNDYSYGLYIYAFPIQQLLALWGVYRWGYWPYSLLSVALTIPFAVASWWAIEKHALKLKNLELRPAKTAPVAEAVSDKSGLSRLTEERDLEADPPSRPEIPSSLL